MNVEPTADRVELPSAEVILREGRRRERARRTDEARALRSGGKHDVKRVQRRLASEIRALKRGDFHGDPKAAKRDILLLRQRMRVLAARLRQLETPPQQIVARPVARPRAARRTRAARAASAQARGAPSEPPAPPAPRSLDAQGAP